MLNKNAVIYVRVSSKEQVDGSSLATQEKICTEYALREGYKIVDVYVEEGESAKTTNRTELQRLIKYVKDNPQVVNSIIVYKIDRLARKAEDHIYLKVFFKKYGIDLHSATEPIDDSPQGGLMEIILAGFAEFDNRIRTERCLNGMISALKDGRWTWKAPVGYKNAKVDGKFTLIHDPLKVELVKKIWTMINDGYSSEQTRLTVNREGLRTCNGEEIRQSHFFKMLRNKLYAGIIEGLGVSVKASFEPIIEKDLFFRVLDIIEGRANIVSHYKKDNEDFAIRGLVYCQDCGHKFTGGWSQGRHQKYAYYRCRCKNKNLPREELESKFYTLLNDLSFDSKFSSLLTKVIQLEMENRNKSSLNNQIYIDTRLEELKKKRKQIIQKSVDNILPDKDVKDLLYENDRQINLLQIEKKSNLETYINVSEVISKGIYILENILNTWKMSDLKGKKQLQKFLFPLGLPFDGFKFRTARLPLCIELQQSWKLQNIPLVAPRGIEPLSGD